MSSFSLVAASFDNLHRANSKQIKFQGGPGTVERIQQGLQLTFEHIQAVQRNNSANLKPLFRVPGRYCLPGTSHWLKEFIHVKANGEGDFEAFANATFSTIKEEKHQTTRNVKTLLQTVLYYLNEDLTHKNFALYKCPTKTCGNFLAQISESAHRCTGRAVDPSLASLTEDSDLVESPTTSSMPSSSDQAAASSSSTATMDATTLSADDSASALLDQIYLPQPDQPVLGRHDKRRIVTQVLMQQRFAEVADIDDLKAIPEYASASQPDPSMMPTSSSTFVLSNLKWNRIPLNGHCVQLERFNSFESLKDSDLIGDLVEECLEEAQAMLDKKQAKGKPKRKNAKAKKDVKGKGKSSEQ